MNDDANEQQAIVERGDSVKRSSSLASIDSSTGSPFKRTFWPIGCIARIFCLRFRATLVGVAMIRTRLIVVVFYNLCRENTIFQFCYRIELSRAFLRGNARHVSKTAKTKKNLNFFV
jgi:hypothetical protein